MKRTKQSTFAKRERQEKATGFAPVGSEDMSKSEGAQFTPGPWVINANGDITSPHGAICWLPSGIAYKQANAHLIAAAPVMYADLRIIRDYLYKLYDDGNMQAGEYAASLDTTLAQAEGRQG